MSIVLPLTVANLRRAVTDCSSLGLLQNDLFGCLNELKKTEFNKKHFSKSFILTLPVKVKDYFLENVPGTYTVIDAKHFAHDISIVVVTNTLYDWEKILSDLKCEPAIKRILDLISTQLMMS